MLPANRRLTRRARSSRSPDAPLDKIRPVVVYYRWREVIAV